MRFYYSLVLLFFLLLGSCHSNNTMLKMDEDNSDCDYSTCNSNEPHIAVLRVKFTRTSFQPNPDVFLLLGRYEDKKILDTINTDTVPMYRNFVLIPVNVDHYYTVVAKYIKDRDTIYAIDGSYVSKNFYYLCDSICWKIEGNELNIKLKN